MVIFVCLLLVQLFIVGQANVLPRIVNGHLAKERQFPYVVQIEKPIQNTSEVSYCGGSIIANDWVLTAAHCTENAEWVILYYGSTWSKRKHRMVLAAKDHVFQHPQYNDIINDIALIRTKWVQFSDRIQSIPLPTEPKNGYNNYVGEWATVAGWGHLHDNHYGSDRLYWAMLQVVDESVCENVYGKSVKGVLCATSDVEQSVCCGDSGGPLVLENQLIGVVSFVSSISCEAGYPMGFADVSRYLGWIRHVSGVGRNVTVNGK